MLKLWLDDLRDPPGPGWTWRRSVEEAIAIFDAERVDEASLDYDLGDGNATGLDLLRWLAKADRWPARRLAVHSTHRLGLPSMCSFVTREGPYRRLPSGYEFER
jgi:hypothetical protein